MLPSVTDGLTYLMLYYMLFNQALVIQLQYTRCHALQLQH
jgi:hypothetical protein